MSKNYLSYLISKSKQFAKNNKSIFDIVIYGSAMKGKEEPSDIDILLIFLQNKLEERLLLTSKLKNILKEKIHNIDIKSINLPELFESSFLARQGIINEGHSLVYNEPFSKRLGFNGYALYTYSLRNLTHNQKTKFTYALIGRTREGILRKLNVQPLGRGVFLVPIRNSLVFEDFLNSWNIKFIKKIVLVSSL